MTEYEELQSRAHALAMELMELHREGKDPVRTAPDKSAEFHRICDRLEEIESMTPRERRACGCYADDVDQAVANILISVCRTVAKTPVYRPWF